MLLEISSTIIHHSFLAAKQLYMRSVNVIVLAIELGLALGQNERCTSDECKDVTRVQTQVPKSKTVQS